MASLHERKHAWRYTRTADSIPPEARHASTMAARSVLVQCIAAFGIDHFPGKVVVEPAARHGGEVPVALLLALLRCPEGPEPAAPGERHGGLPLAPPGVGIELLVERRHRLVERVAVDAGHP